MYSFCRSTLNLAKVMQFLVSHDLSIEKDGCSGGNQVPRTGSVTLLFGWRIICRTVVIQLMLQERQADSSLGAQLLCSLNTKVCFKGNLVFGLAGASCSSAGGNPP